MKIEGYKPSVGLNTINGSVKVSGDKMAYGASGAGFDALGNAAGKWAETVQKQYDDEDRQTILDALDLYNKGRYNIMYNDQTGLMHTKLDGSVGIADSFTEQEQKLRSDILGNLKLHNKDNAVALNGMMNKSAYQGWEQVHQYQLKQADDLVDVRYKNNVDNMVEMAQKEWNNPDVLDSLLDDTHLLASAAYGLKSDSQVLIDEKSKSAMGQIASAAITQAITTGDYKAARSYQDKYGHYLTAQQRAAFNKTVLTKEADEYSYNTAESLYDMYGDDEAAVRAAIENVQVFEPVATEGISWVRNDNVSLEGIQEQVVAGLSDISKVYKELSGTQLIVTSGTDSTDIHAAGPHSHGAGIKLDIAGDWLESAENRALFIADMESKGIKVLDEYSNPSPNSTGGHLDLDFTNYKSRGGRRLLNHEEKRNMLADYQRIREDKKRIERIEFDKLFDAVSSDIIRMKDAGTKYTDAMKWAEQQAGADYKKLKNYKSAVKAVYGGYGKNGSTSGAGIKTVGCNRLFDMLKAGNFANKGELMDYARYLGANDADMDKLYKGYDDYLNGEGIFKFDFNGMIGEILGNVKLPKGKEASTKAGLKAALNLFVRDYRHKHNGTDPSDKEVLEAGAKALKTKVYGKYVTDRGWLWDSEKQLALSDAQLARAGIASVKRVDGTEDMYAVEYSDGRVGGIVNGEYLDDVAGGF